MYCLFSQGKEISLVRKEVIFPLSLARLGKEWCLYTVAVGFCGFFLTLTLIDIESVILPFKLGAWKDFSGDENVQYLDCSSDYMTLYNL